MTKSLRRKKTMRRSRKMRGGQSSVASTAGPVDSGHSYVLGQYGNGDTQWNNVFGPQSTSVMGNEIVNLQHPQQVPAMMYPMKGGRRTRRTRRRKGGNLLSAAAVTPFALWGIQRAYSRRMKSRRKGKGRK